MWRGRSGAPREVGGGADENLLEVRSNPYGDHVLGDLLAQAHAGVVPAGHDIGQAIVIDDFDSDIRVVGQEPDHGRREDRVRGFRTSLLAAENVSYAKSSIADYAHEGSAEDTWSGYDGKQPNDPDKLGDALVKLANMPAPPRFFVAGPDALDAVRPVMEARLKDMEEHEDLSRAMVGDEGPLDTHPGRR
jgi:hypothetical protein